MKSITLCLLLAFFNLSYAQSNDFPGRTVYPKINVYETSQLLSSFDDVIIVDARSQYEYNVQHINTAINIPLSAFSTAALLISAAPAMDSTSSFLFILPSLSFLA